MSPLSLIAGKEYEGLQIELVVGIDVGTTFSGVSYAFLLPGEVPDILSVTNYTNQEQSSRKVPSVVYYNNGGDVVGAGANIPDELDDVVKAEHFKLHLRPPGTELRTNGMLLGGLPAGKSAEVVLGDFLRYLWKETVVFIKDHQADGPKLMIDVEQRIHFILGHPNGWVGRPQQRMREGAILGGLVSSDDDAQARINFVTEGEASALTCLASSYAPHPLLEGYRFIILDAGGGTLDVSGYEVTASDPPLLKEFAVSISRFAGSIFVNSHAREIVKDLLRDSQFDDDDTLDDVISQDFEKNAKPAFHDSDRISRLRMSTRATIPRLNIRNGGLVIPGERIAECFDFSVTQAVESIASAGNRVYTSGHTSNQHVWLVGGFGSSKWLLKRLRDILGPIGYEFCQPSDSNLSKAVADGAVHHYLYGSITARMSRACYGTGYMTRFDPSDPSHASRLHLVRRSELFGHRIGPVFDCIVKKNESIEVSSAHSCSYTRKIFDAKNARRIRDPIYCWDEETRIPYWLDEDRAKLQELCQIEADLSELCTEKSKKSLAGVSTYWVLRYEIEIKMGTTEIEARIKWKENSETKYGPARVVYG